MPMSQHDEIVRSYGRKAKQQLFTTWLTGHPCPSWDKVRGLLRCGVRGEEGRRAAHEVEETYLKSELEILGQLSNNLVIFCCILGFEISSS